MFQEHRLGMFVHWGLYAVRGYHEQEQQRLSIPRSEYALLADRFAPDAFDPGHWIERMRAMAGSYLVFTAKHHDGFCLWNSRRTYFNVTRSSARRDVLLELSLACAREKVPLGIYYSCVDWHDPHYPNAGRHHELAGPESGDIPDMDRYLETVRAHIEELCGGAYGRFATFWWDMNVPEYHDPSINARIRELQPGILINNRGYDEGDFSTPERDWGGTLESGADHRLVEACQSVGSLSWGFKKDEDYYTERYLKASIARHLSAGHNYLLNVGPNADGRIPEPAAERLMAIGKWLSNAGKGLIGTQLLDPLPDAPGVLLTRVGDAIYCFLIGEIPTEGLRLRPIDVAPDEVIDLHTGQTIEWKLDKVPFDAHLDRAFLRLINIPRPSSDTVTVLRLRFDRNLPAWGRSETSERL